MLGRLCVIYALGPDGLFSITEVLAEPGYPGLQLTLVVIEAKGTGGGISLGYSYSFTLNLLQNVFLIRHPKIGHTLGVTWEAAVSLGVTGKDGATQAILDHVGLKADLFINAFLAANPRN